MTHELETSPVWGLTPTAPQEVAPALVGTTTADVVVVGAGLTGAVLAFRLRQLAPELEVVVLEAESVGSGATGHSTGIVGPGLSTALRGLRQRYGDDRTRQAFAQSQQGIAVIRGLVQSLGIETDLRPGSHIIAATTGPQEARLIQHLADLDALGLAATVLDKGEASAGLRTEVRAAFQYDNVLLLDPLRLVRGLAAAAGDLGAVVHERSRVVRWSREGDRIVVSTHGGSVHARTAVLAVDGYAGSLPAHASSVVPVRTHVVATEPLTPDQLGDLGWGATEAVIDQRNFFDYYRTTSDRRLVFGGGVALSTSGDPSRDAAASARVHDRVISRMRGRFPGLAEVAVAARWSGLTGGTLDRLPVVGPLPGEPLVHYLGGWCGHGLSLSAATASAYAERLAATLTSLQRPAATGKAEAPDAHSLPWDRSKTVGLPGWPWTRPALTAYLTALDLADQRATPRPLPSREGAHP